MDRCIKSYFGGSSLMYQLSCRLSWLLNVVLNRRIESRYSCAHRFSFISIFPSNTVSTQNNTHRHTLIAYAIYPYMTSRIRRDIKISQIFCYVAYICCSHMHTYITEASYSDCKCNLHSNE